MEGLQGFGKPGQNKEGDSLSHIPGVLPWEAWSPPLNPAHSTGADDCGLPVAVGSVYEWQTRGMHSNNNPKKIQKIPRFIYQVFFTEITDLEVVNFPKPYNCDAHNSHNVVIIKKRVKMRQEWQF